MDYPLRRLVNGSQHALIDPESITPSDRKLTPANVMTWLRPTVFGLSNMYMIIKGKRGATASLIPTIASDAEGNVARFISKHWPDSGLGVSKHGIREDPIADTLAIGEIVLGTFISKKTSRLAKFAAGIIVAQEAKKALWAYSADRAYRAATTTKANPRGEKLIITPDVEGKLAMTEKAIAGTAIVATAETSNPIIRTGLGLVALGFAIAGSWRADKIQSTYQRDFEQQMATIPTSQDINNLNIINFRNTT